MSEIRVKDLKPQFMGQPHRPILYCVAPNCDTEMSANAYDYQISFWANPNQVLKHCGRPMQLRDSDASAT